MLVNVMLNDEMLNNVMLDNDMLVNVTLRQCNTLIQ